MTKRYQPSWPFPSYVFVPGRNPHPKKKDGHMENEKDPVAPPVDLLHPDRNEFLRFALDLFNHRYFWESHVYFEALWNAHGRRGPESDFLKGLIKLGAAFIKVELRQKTAAVGHFHRAKELFDYVKKSQGPNFLGFDLQKITEEVDQALDQNLSPFEIHPSWN